MTTRTPPRSRRSLALLALAAALVGAPACGHKTGKTSSDAAKLKTPSRELDFAAQAFLQRYDNGLTLFVAPDPFTRVVQFDVRQAVGSRDDPTGKYGLAHFVEHLMFQVPSGDAGSPPLMSTIGQHTLFFNAYTSNDETHYIHTGVAAELETYFQYTQKRLAYDCDAVPEQQFLRERDVVRQEIRWRRNDVDATVFTRMLEKVFPEGHPYRQDASGNDLQIASMSRDDACAFIRRYYTASQAIVVVTGDIDPGEVKALADKYLAPLPKVEPAKRAKVSVPALSARTETLSAPVKKPTAAILFAMPPRFTRDNIIAGVAQEAALTAVSFFVRGRGSAVKDWGVAALGGKEALVFGISIETKKANQLDRAVDEVLDAIVRAFESELASKEDRAVYDSNRQRARLGILDQIATVQSRAGAYADYLEEPKPTFYGSQLALIDELTPAEVQTFGRHYFARNRALVIKVIPDGKADSAARSPRANYDYKPTDSEALSVPADIDPSEARRPLALKGLTRPDGVSLEYELENGMKVVLVQSSQYPVMDVRVIVGAGEVDGGDTRDMALLAARSYGLREDNREAALTNQGFQLAGGIFRADVDATSTTFRSRGLSIYLDYILSGVSERVVQAEYMTGALDFWKQGRRDALKKESQAQRDRRSNAFFTALYGEGHPHVRAAIVDSSKLRDLSLSDLEGFRASYYRGANTTVIVTGGFDVDLATQYVEAYFGAPKLRNRRSTWQEPKITQERTRAPEPKPEKVRTIAQFDKEAIQTDITIAFPLAEVYGEDHAALAVLGEMLSFEVSTVREQLGASYGVYGRVDTDRPRIVVGGSVDSARAPEAMAAMLAGLQRLRDGEDFDRRFAFARRKVVNEMAQVQGDSELLAGRLAESVRRGVGYEYFESLASQISTLSPEAVKAQIDRHLLVDRAVTLLQGPEDAVKKVIAAQKIVDVNYLPTVVHEEDEE
ncbi:MAG: insulinase family protein [Nannocystaceae bacterium]